MVTMWEARASAGRGADLVAWATSHAPAGGDVYASSDDRVVIIAAAPLELPAVPAELVDRSPHAWDFAKVR